MAVDARLVVEVPAGGVLAERLRHDPPPSLAAGDSVLAAVATGPDGRLEPSDAGEVVMSVPSPETLRREPDEVRRVVDHAGAGVEPLVILVETAEELREDELAVMVDAARRTRRNVILRIVGAH